MYSCFVTFPPRRPVFFHSSRVAGERTARKEARKHESTGAAKHPTSTSTSTSTRSRSNAHAHSGAGAGAQIAMVEEDVLMSPPSSVDIKTVGFGGGGGGGAAGEGEEGASRGAPRVELAYEPRYQR